MLELFVGSKAKHFFSTTRCISLLETLMNDVEELLKLKGGSFF